MATLFFLAFWLDCGKDFEVTKTLDFFDVFLKNFTVFVQETSKFQEMRSVKPFKAFPSYYNATLFPAEAAATLFSNFSFTSVSHRDAII